MIALIRLILASSGLLIIYYIPSEPERDVALTYSALVLYTLYSATVYVLEIRGARLLWVLHDWGHWIDVGCYTVLITLTSGTNSIFFFGYFLPILVASFRWGFRSGMRVVVISTLLFATLGYISAPSEPDFEMQRSAIRPIYLLTLGYMISYWGGAEVQVKRRLGLLKDVGTISNPRFGVDRTIGLMMHRLMSFFEADDCSLVTVDAPSNIASLRRVSRSDPESPAHAEPIPAKVAQLMLAFPVDHIVIYCAPALGRWLGARAHCRTFPSATGGAATSDVKGNPTADKSAEMKVDGGAGGRLHGAGEAKPDRTANLKRDRKTTAKDHGLEQTNAELRLEAAPSIHEESGVVVSELPQRAVTGTDTLQGTCEVIADVLDAPSFMAVPIHFANRRWGRLYVTMKGRRIFEESNAVFLQVAVESALPLIDNIRLVNQLASSAAGEERQKIARDIHDSVIQPYIGLQIGLAGVHQKLAGAGSELCRDVERLMELTNLGIADLRRQVSELKGRSADEGSLLPAVLRFAAKFSDATGITVRVEAEEEIRVEDRLAAETFQMVVEGLSNIRRHTQASHATVGLACRDGFLLLRIENEGEGRPCAVFSPRSIADRATALGGVASVLTRDNGATVVSVQVPL